MFQIVYQKCLFQPFFSGEVLEHLSGDDDLNVLLNFSINRQAFIIVFQNFNNISRYRYISFQSWSPKRAKDIIFGEQKLIISIL